MCLEKDVNWLVGVIEGEGCFSMARGGRKVKYFNLSINITNTDVLLLNECKRIVDSLGCYCRFRKRSENYIYIGKKRSDIVIEGFENILKFLDIIMDSIRGEKKLQAELMRSYIRRRMSLRKGKKYPKCDDIDNEYYLAITSLKHLTKSVETTRFSTDKVEDIVRAARISEGAELSRNDSTLLSN